MKLYDGGLAPNPRRVRIFLAEKGVEIPLVTVDMGALEHRGEEVASRNPLKRLPVMELDDGTILSESVAICRYIEELHPDPPLMGEGAQGRAIVEMWQRRMEMHLLLLVANVFRHAHPAMAGWEVPQIKEFSEANKPKVLETLRWLNDELADRQFIAGDEYSIADITAVVAVDFMKPSRIQIPEEHEHLLRWYSDIHSRPSTKA